MNKIFITNSRLGKDVDVRQTQDGKTVARFNVACDRKYSKDKTDWFSIVAFDKQGEFCEKYLHKGSKVNIVGRVQPDNYTNKDGNKVNTFDVICEEIEFAESKKEAEQNKAEEKPETKEDDGFMNVEDTDDMELPFA